LVVGWRFSIESVSRGKGGGGKALVLVSEKENGQLSLHQYSEGRGGEVRDGVAEKKAEGPSATPRREEKKKEGKEICHGKKKLGERRIALAKYEKKATARTSEGLIAQRNGGKEKKGKKGGDGLC